MFVLNADTRFLKLQAYHHFQDLHPINQNFSYLVHKGGAFGFASSIAMVEPMVIVRLCNGLKGRAYTD
ncbi:hypothetical protein RHMOL_Rhmol07G0235000 [Rhododendron molle]|uniref:Uncharacterized protein n=1 Tax=Rhododendron molle TaxID=49168 RepID=A0ACC0N4N2_RHOML|nr:hypothetical protein RHMOL_Rhmol07G0235000 [Rhododendron molle]